jgi:hypothetical protein
VEAYEYIIYKLDRKGRQESILAEGKVLAPDRDTAILLAGESLVEKLDPGRVRVVVRPFSK